MTTKDDQEEFEKWLKIIRPDLFKEVYTCVGDAIDTGLYKLKLNLPNMDTAWLAACEYKNKEIAKLKDWKASILYHVPNIDENRASAQKEIAELKERIKELERD